MSKSKKDKTGTVSKIARKTIGLVARVGDALEAAAAAAVPAPPAPPAPSVPAAPPVANVAVTLPVAKVPVVILSPSVPETPPVANAPVGVPSPSVPVAPPAANGSASSPLLPAASVASSPEVSPAIAPPGSDNAVAVAVVSKTVEAGTRAIEAIEVYAALHNLRSVDMPSLGTLLDAVMSGMAQHGSNFTDAHLRSLMDEQMRIHLRTLGTRSERIP